jgi:hypothetical protein
MEAAESARQNMDFDSFKPGDAIEVTVLFDIDFDNIDEEQR